MRTRIVSLLFLAVAVGACQPQNTRSKLHLTDLDGNPVHGLQTSANDYLLVNFWATWCKPCIEEMPSLERLQEHAGQDLQIILVSSEDAQKVQEFIRKYNIGLPVYIMQGAEETFQLQFLPTTMLFSPAGEVLIVEEGERAWDSTNMIQMLYDEMGK